MCLTKEVRSTNRYKLVKRCIRLGRLEELRKRLEEARISTKESFEKAAGKNSYGSQREIPKWLNVQLRTAFIQQYGGYEIIRRKIMPYIPKEHQRYDLLPYCRMHGGEVFEYPSRLIDQTVDILGSSEGFFPYGFDSYEEYFASLDGVIAANEDKPEAVKLLKQIGEEMLRLNRKEEWSILRYAGPSTGQVLGLTKGKTYYWPTTKANPIYNGVIDDEEFTSYLYPTDADLWEILEDPTGMAHRTIYQNGKGGTSKEIHEYIMRQVRAMQVAM